MGEVEAGSSLPVSKAKKESVEVKGISFHSS